MAVQVIWGNRGEVEQSLLSGTGQPGLCDYSYKMSGYVVLGFAFVFFVFASGRATTNPGCVHADHSILLGPVLHE